MKISPPTSTKELLARSQQVAGLTLGEVATNLGETVPCSLLRAKGWIGQLIEKALGANAVNLDQPDFIDLGIELKTIPINGDGNPSESTYICTAQIPHQEACWEQSRVWRKMNKMLWVPIEQAPHKPLSQCRIGTPLLWYLPPAIEAQLKQDWEELTELIQLGHYEDLNAYKGKYLQIRPKAANSKTFIQVIDHLGQTISTVPKGFYIRTLLTREILQTHYVV